MDDFDDNEEDSRTKEQFEAADAALQLATLRELVDELFRRHQGVLLVRIEFVPNGGDENQGGPVKTSYKGGATSALGMAEVAKDIIKESMYCDGQDDDEE
jgi:hypothetical protein